MHPQSNCCCQFVAVRAVCGLALSLLVAAVVPGQGATPAPKVEDKAGSPAAKQLAYVVERGVGYVERDGQSLRADFYVPRKPGPHPGILMMHGGGWRVGSKSQMVGHAVTAANHGYVVMSINYRLAPQHKFPAQIHDCKAALRYWRQHAEQTKLDPRRVAAYGYSAGGHLAALLGTTDPSHGLEGLTCLAAEEQATEEGTPDDYETSTRVQAVVLGGAPYDFQIMPPDLNFLRYWLGGTRTEKPDVYRLASPQEWVSRDDPPTYLFHGEKDWLVPIFTAEHMQDTLRRAGVRSELMICSGKGHFGAFMDAKAKRGALRFLDEVLRTDGDVLSPVAELRP